MYNTVTCVCVCVSGMLNLLVGAVVDVLCCRYQWGGYNQTEHNDVHQPNPANPPAAAAAGSINAIYSNLPSTSSVTESVQLVSAPMSTTFDT